MQLARSSWDPSDNLNILFLENMTYSLTIMKLGAHARCLNITLLYKKILLVHAIQKNLSANLSTQLLKFK